MDPLKHSNTRRAASDLLRWSMGGKPRDGREYVEYKAPSDLAKPPRSLILRLRAALLWPRALGIMALRAVLLWWLSFDEKREQRNGSRPD